MPTKLVKYTYISLFFVCFLLSCNNKEDSKATEEVKPPDKAIIHAPAVVVVDLLKSGDFNLEIISNGKVYANRNAEIRFPINEEIEEIYVSNGLQVRKGQLLAKLNSNDLANKLQKIVRSIDRSKVELDDRLIDYGYRLRDSSKVPKNIMEMAKLKSGYSNLIHDYTDARRDLSKTRILAPFSGRIADLEAKANNNTESFHKLCNILDDDKMVAEFNVLEAEVNAVNIGAKVQVALFGDSALTPGVVSAMNPKVDENGMIQITAVVDNKSRYLMHGMSVRIFIRRAIKNKLFVKKEAVLRRQDKDVVFSYREGRAQWNYVTTGIQNSKYVIIESGLKAGQMIITGNNFNLAHDTEVQIQQ